MAAERSWPRLRPMMRVMGWKPEGRRRFFRGSVLCTTARPRLRAGTPLISQKSPLFGQKEIGVFPPVEPDGKSSGKCGSSFR